MPEEEEEIEASEWPCPRCGRDIPLWMFHKVAGFVFCLYCVGEDWPDEG